MTPAPIRAIPFNEVALTDTFWRPRLETQKRVTLPFAFTNTERSVENLQRCADFLAGREGPLPMPHRFITSDLYKVMEGAAYLIQLEPDLELEAKMDALITLIGEAQQEDGYLYLSHICGNISSVEEMGERPYDWLVHSHELYNVGHMYEGAVAYFQATGKRAWLDIAEKSAAHVQRVIIDGDPNYHDGKPVNQAPGHQEIELALCKLYDVTGNPDHLNLAKRLLDIRGVTYCPDGEGVMHPEYAQQHAPVGEQKRAVGHAVRAGYMYAAMADVDARTGRHDYADALERIWQNLVDTKIHITGGLGAIHGIEGFGPEFDLPNKDAYNETCAAIANVLFNHRLALAHCDARFFDVAEIALLNNGLSGVNLGGDRFFYVNPLEADGHTRFNHGDAGRSPWFDCACCPSNVARTMPQVAGYMYGQTDQDVYLLLYGASSVQFQHVQITQTTRYPFGGHIHLDLALETPAEFAINLRIPTWVGEQFVPGQLYKYANTASPWEVGVNGVPVECEVRKGFAVIRRKWQDGDRIELHLPMPVRYSVCDERVEANRDRMCVTRGPLVYCAEEIDNDGPVQQLALPKIPTTSAIGDIPDGPLAGMPRLMLANISLVPYFAWNNRDSGSMIVWLPREAAESASAAREALTWEAGAGTQHVWEVAMNGELKSVGVKWGVPPERWWLEARIDGEWIAVEKYITDFWGTDLERYNVVHPAAEMGCDGLRLQIVGEGVNVLDLDVQRVVED